MLNSAIKCLQKNDVIKDLTSQIEYSHYVKILKSFSQKNVIKRVILKDATASFIQNLIRIMGHKNDDSLKYANLNSCDE
jgi:hypothetical protein